MNNLITTNIENLIYEVRGKQVMLASDVAKLYDTETKRVNEVIKRNINRFPESFCFQLSIYEYENLKSQIATSNYNTNNHGGIRYLPYVLTEQGILMLSGLLKSDKAAIVNVNVIEAFVKMKKFIINNIDTFKELNEIKTLTIQNTNDIKLLQNSFNKLEEKTKINHIFFEGQIYDSYSFLIDLFNKANNEIIIIDNYAGKELLDIIKEIDKKIIIVSSNIDDKLKEKYVKQYSNVEFKDNKTFHDRFIIIDKSLLYHSGGSFKDLGKKCIGINKIDDINYLNEIMKIIKI